MVRNDPLGLETGNEKRINFYTSEKIKAELTKVMADIDTSMTYEELMVALIRLHDENPNRLEKYHY